MNERAAILDELTENNESPPAGREPCEALTPRSIAGSTPASPSSPRRGRTCRRRRTSGGHFKCRSRTFACRSWVRDPYPNPQHAVGLSVFTGPQGTFPASHRNIYRNLEQCGYAPPADGDLSAWADQGVMLLNRAPTLPLNVTARPHRHLRWWAPVIIPTMRAIEVEAAECPVAAMLWGTAAHGMRRYLEPNVEVFAASHPSAQSVSRGGGAKEPFRDARPFATVNQWLVQSGAPGVDWTPARPNGGAGT